MAEADYSEVQMVFVHRIEDCKKRVRLISKFVDDNMKVDFDNMNMNWGQVGDTCRLLEQLDEIITTFNLRTDT